MHDGPLLAVVVGKKFRACHVKNTPTLCPELGILGAVTLAKGFEHLIGMLILLEQPSLQRPAVVSTVDRPSCLFLQCFCRGRKQLRRRHDTSGEEIFRHPVLLAFRLKEISVLSVTEDMDEELASGLEPITDPLE